jgi:hypothetical protein
MIRQVSCHKKEQVKLQYCTPSFLHSYISDWGTRGDVMVKALLYKPAGRGFDSQSDSRRSTRRLCSVVRKLTRSECGAVQVVVQYSPY